MSERLQTQPASLLKPESSLITVVDHPRISRRAFVAGSTGSTLTHIMPEDSDARKRRNNNHRRRNNHHTKRKKANIVCNNNPSTPRWRPGSHIRMIDRAKPANDWATSIQENVAIWNASFSYVTMSYEGDDGGIGPVEGAMVFETSYEPNGYHGQIMLMEADEEYYINAVMIGFNNYYYEGKIPAYPEDHRRVSLATHETGHGVGAQHEVLNEDDGCMWRSSPIPGQGKPLPGDPPKPGKLTIIHLAELYTAPEICKRRGRKN